MATFAILKFVEFVIEGYLILVLITISVIISDGSNDKNHRQLMAEEELNKHPELIVKSGLYYDKEFNDQGLNVRVLIKRIPKNRKNSKKQTIKKMRFYLKRLQNLSLFH